MRKAAKTFSRTKPWITQKKDKYPPQEVVRSLRQQQKEVGTFKEGAGGLCEKR